MLFIQQTQCSRLQNWLSRRVANTNRNAVIGDVFVQKYYLLLTAHGTPEEEVTRTKLSSFSFQRDSRSTICRRKQFCKWQLLTKFPNRMIHIFGGEPTPQCLPPRKSYITSVDYIWLRPKLAKHENRVGFRDQYSLEQARFRGDIAPDLLVLIQVTISW
jgi:hypothetical protein